MAKRPAAWYRNVALLGTVVALLMVPAMEGLQEAHLALWLHIPLTFIVLNLMAIGALAAGIAFVEYRSRSVDRRQEA